MDDLLRDAAARSIRYLDTLDERGVAPTAEAVAALETLDIPFPESGNAPAEVLRELDAIGSPATVGMAGRRYFGFVIGGSLPASLAANWLAGAWDQNAFAYQMSPVASKLETIALRWMADALGLPDDTGGAFVTGATMANFSALAAARHAVLDRVGWQVERDGLFGAPVVTVIMGEEAHPTVYKSLGLLGFGRERVVRVPVDAQGRMRADVFPAIEGPTIVCLQAGNVNTGAFDPAEAIIPRAKAAGAWVHVDGAFGLWAAASPAQAHLMAGFAGADSWATDAHKWLNVPYDSGLAFLREPEALRAAMSISAAYLPQTEYREPGQYTPESSRRARAIEIWAALRSLGRAGLAEMVDRTCRHATRFAEGLTAAGFEILNEVVLNQVLVSFGDDEATRRVVSLVQDDGTSWCGPTFWHGRAAMRISVSSWATTEEDVDQSIAAMVRLAKEQ